MGATRTTVAVAVALALALAAGAGGSATRARAQDRHAGSARAALSSARTVPDYDGRASPGATAGEVLLWIPRIIFAPLYLVTEYVLRRPLAYLLAAAERSNVPALLIDTLSSDGPRTSGFAPTALVDYGLRPSVGLYAYWDDVGFRGHDLRLRVATWGIDWLALAAADRVRLSERSRLTLKVALSRRNDRLFYGLGPELSADGISRFRARAFDVGLSFEAEPWRLSTVRWYAGVRRASFESDACCGELSVGDRVMQGSFAELPPGFADGYSVWLQRMTLVLDTRRSVGSGVRVELRGGQAFELSDPTRRSWVEYGGSVGAFLDLTDTRRLVGLSLAALFAESLPGSEPIPFTELVALGGDELMRGFVAGRLLGDSAIVATLDYRWPVWIGLDGSVVLSVGNVLPGQLEGLSLDRMRLSATVGFRASSRVDHSFDFLFGVGTEPFDAGFRVTSFRFVIGTKDGF